MTVARAFTQVKRSKPQIGLTGEKPDWDCRSVLTLSAGSRFLMRNGHTAEIRVSKTFDLASGQTDNPDCPRKDRKFVVWYGRCVECNEPLGWNANGTYAAVGKHPLDLVEAL